MRVNTTHNKDRGGKQMRNIGFIRKVDSLGRIVIPKEIREISGFDSGSLLFVHWQDRKLIFEEYQKICAFCGVYPALEFGSKVLCADCYADLRCHIKAQKTSPDDSAE